ncbi:MAG: GFA family protein [Sphingomonas sp.]|nr:GFA family protein [Sphingomonas sp.]
MAKGLEGGCRCGAVRYEVTGAPVYVALCHCADCRKSAGAPMVSWSAFAEGAVSVTAGAPRDYASSEQATRSFCAACGTGLFYRNPAVLPGLIDIQAATLDDPEALPPHIHVQTAERLSWMHGIDALPAFERYPSSD